MSPTTLEPRQRIVPVRACGRCDAVDDVFHLTMVGRTWLCKSCHHSLRFPEPEPASAAPRAAAVPVEPPSARESVAERLRRLDSAVRWGGIGVRIVVYLALLALTHRHPLLEYLMIGFFAADAFGWMLHAWWDARFHGWAVTTEAVIYTTVYFTLEATGRLGIPADVQARFLAGGAAALTLGGHWLRFWCKLRIQPL